MFAPGSPISELITIDPLLGSPAVTVLNDPTTTASDQDAPSDFCAPLVVDSEIYGVVNGKPFRTNPQHQALTTSSLSQRTSPTLTETESRTRSTPVP